METINRCEFYDILLLLLGLLVDYEVTVVTGGHKHSGIDSRVYLTLMGAQGRRSLKQQLCYKDGSHCFRRGAVDSFKLRSKDIGTLSKIRLVTKMLVQMESSACTVPAEFEMGR